MSAESSPNSTVLFRNGAIFVAFCRTVSVATAVLAALMSLCIIVALFPLAGMTWARALQALCWFFGAFSFASICPYLWTYGNRLGFYHVLLDPYGVEFLFGSKANPKPVRMAWDQVHAVQHQRVAGAHQYTVLAKDGSSAILSSSIFFHTKKIAQLIAARAHLPVEEL